ncbi:MAG: formylmethanofuran--tetrahydromethanopterin N-formyltransferase [Candidatus Hodarchaeota archaeon]
MEINGVEIEDTFCEAFGAWFTRILVTAKNEKWVQIAAREATGYGTSGIGCDAEAGIDVLIPGENTFDKRPGAALMFFVRDKKKISDVMLHRVGQCILTSPTAACFDLIDGSLEPEKEFEIKTGFFLKFFGDKYEEKVEGVYPFPIWKIPIMAGEFIVQNTLMVGKGIAGGNFLIIGKDQDSVLEAAEKAIEVINNISNLITPFPGGIVPSGSKVGTRYENVPGLFATTNHAYCPTLRTKVEDTKLREEDGCVFEIVLDGATEEVIKSAMRRGIEAAVKVPGVNRISAGNYGGKLGKFHYRLHDILG